MAGQIVRPPAGAKLFERRIGASILRSGWHTGMRLNKAKWSWPLGKLTLYPDRLEIRALFFRPFVLSLSEVTAIKSSFGRVLVQHTNEDVPDHVALTGLGLFDALRAAVMRNGLQVRVES